MDAPRKVEAHYYTRNHCILCLNQTLTLAVPLRPTPIFNPNTGILKHPTRVTEASSVPLDLYRCETCHHLQLASIGDPALQYSTYTYRTSISKGLTEHFATLASDVLTREPALIGNLVVEFGSNDGTTLRYFKSAGCKVLGIDPAREIGDAATASGIPTIVAFFNEAVARSIVNDHGRAKAILANNVLANIDDLDEIAKAVDLLLDKNGIFVFETQYGADVVNHCLLDTIYHEHISYFNIDPLARFFERHGMRLFDVTHLPTKGGSIRCFVDRNVRQPRSSPTVDDMIAREREAGFHVADIYQRLTARIAGVCRAVESLVDAHISAGREVAGYGVSVGTITLINQFNLAKKLAFLVDDDPEKQTALTGPDFNIPIVSPDTLSERNPGCVLVFAWRYVSIIERGVDGYLDRGGSLVVPLPEVRITKRG